MRQGWISMAPAVKELERAIIGRKFRHGGHPVLRWNSRTSQSKRTRLVTTASTKARAAIVLTAPWPAPLPGTVLAPEPYRSDFRRDYARLIHCPAFRRLQGKAQLFPCQENDFFRNRMSHSLEVVQIAKSIAIKINSQHSYGLAAGADDIGVLVPRPHGLVTSAEFQGRAPWRS